MINKYPELPHQSPTIFFYFYKDNRVISWYFSFQFLSPNSASHFLLQRMFVVAGRCHPPATIKRTFMMSCGLLPLIPLNKLLSHQPRGSQNCSARRLAVVLCCAKKWCRFVEFCPELPHWSVLLLVGAHSGVWHVLDKQGHFGHVYIESTYTDPLTCCCSGPDMLVNLFTFIALCIAALCFHNPSEWKDP